MVPPSTIPNTGTIATPVNGTARDTKSIDTTGAKPAASAAVSQAEPRLTWLRRAAVTAATTNITSNTSNDDHSDDIAAASTVH
jgi:hypothetical protein